MSKILCSCQDSQGNPKQSYTSERQANNQKNFIKEDRGVTLKVYKCPEKSGWHLTKEACSVHHAPLNHNNCSPYKRRKTKNPIGNILSEQLINELKNLCSK